MSNNLFNVLPDGCFHLQDFISLETQKELVSMCRELCKTHPLMKPTTKKGYPLSLSVTSFGSVGWFGEGGNYKYLRKHENGKPFPDIPPLISDLMYMALDQCKFPDRFQLDTVLMNYYPANTGKLGRHQDVTEEDKESPIITISLGDSCIFNVGSEDYKDRGFDITLKSGDVVVMGGKSRLAYHEVKSLIPGSSKLLSQGGRISLTGRKVFKGNIRGIVQSRTHDIDLPTETQAKEFDEAMRNGFQSRFPASEIKKLEEKMLPRKDGRLATDPAPSALTKEERMIYAEFLETKNQPLGAKAFREYVETEKKK